RIRNSRAIDDASFSDDRAYYATIEQLRPRKVARARIHRRFRIEKIERRKRQRHLKIRAIECADGSYVFPVTVEQMSLHVEARNRFGDDVLTEINSIGTLCGQQPFQHRFAKNVNTHRSANRAARSLLRRKP